MAQGALTIRFFGGAREVVGARQLRLELSLPTNETKLRAALAERWPELGPHLGHCRLARNDAFVTADERFAAGDTVDVLPPVAGGSTRVHAASIVERAITLEPLVDAVSRHEAGAVASFLGIVRNHHQGDAVNKLAYEAHPVLAKAEMHAVLETVCGRFPGVHLAAEHRVGELPVGEVAVAVAASAPHRDEAFNACRAAIDAIKARVPIWKKEWCESGDTRWVRFDQPNDVPTE